MFQRLLLAIDDSPATEAGTSFVLALARQRGSAVQVLHVNQFITGGRGMTVLSEREAERLVEGAVGELRAAGVSASGIVMRATCFDVGSRIAEAAARFGADAIVVGSRRRRRLSRFLGHGVREAIVASSALPVLTAPAPLRVQPHVPPAAYGVPAQPIVR